MFTKDVDCIWGSLGIVFCSLTIIAQALLVYVFVRLHKKGSATDMIFLQLAALDCLSGIAGLFGSIFLVNERKWFADDDVAGDAICYPAGMMWNMASLTTPLLLSSASVGRFLAVYFPFAYEKYFRKSVVKAMIIYSWSHGFVGASISFAGPNKGVKAYQMFPDWGYCDQTIFDSFDNEAMRKVIYIALFTVPVIVSCFLIITCNLMVAFKILLMKNEARKKKRASAAGLSKPTSIRLMPTFIISKALTRLKNFSVRDTLYHASNTVHSRSSTVNGHNVIGKPSHEFARRPSVREKNISRQRRRENQAILMTLLLSINYCLCYIEIIHYYVTVSMGLDWEQSYIVIFHNVTYVYLWYYFSLFFASGVNALLHLFFNPNVKKAVKSIVLRRSTECITSRRDTFGSPSNV